MNYLVQNEEESSELATCYALNAFGSKTAREFRRIVFAYKFFEKGLPCTWKNQEEHSDYMSLRRQRYLEVKNIDPVIFRFFKTKFGNAFTDELN